MIRDSIGAFMPDGLFEVAGEDEGPLRGARFAAKDIFDVAGRVTGRGNADWAAGRPPAEANAPVVQALLDAGARLVGKTITDELAYSLDGQNHHYGTPTNVNAPGRICGGSSCGSASAVAAGLVDFALGSDTGGSIRIPGSYCGLFGLRPTHGAISLDGVMPLSPSLDVPGWFAREAGPLRRVGEVILDDAVSNAAAPTGLLLAEDAFDLLEPGVRARLDPWVERLEARLGQASRVRPGDPDGLEALMWCFRFVQAREAWEVHGAWIEGEEPRLGPTIADRFKWAKSVTDAQVVPERERRRTLTARLDELLSGGQVLCLPTAPGIAPQVNAPSEARDRHRAQVLQLTCLAGLAGLPQITLPLASSAGCPLGLSLIGPRGSDLALLAFAESFCGDHAWPG